MQQAEMLKSISKNKLLSTQQHSQKYKEIGLNNLNSHYKESV